MKIAILGGGITGLTASYYLAKKGHEVALFEKSPILGGLASGFQKKGWTWSLERAYHHLFSNDHYILDFARQIGFNGIFFKTPQTASLYYTKNNTSSYQIFPFDTPRDVLTLPHLSLTDKLRLAATIGFFKYSPFLSVFEKETAESFLKKTMGEKVWNTLWQQLFRKKFGKYAENILASFIWARIKKRTRELGYIEGGFQSLIDYIECYVKDLHVKIKTNFQIDRVTKRGEQYMIDGQLFDRVISTLPTPVLRHVTKDIFPEYYLKKLSRINYLHALNLIIEGEKPLLNATYWLNILIKEFPFMVAVQHTNFVSKQYYGNRHILYIGNYLVADHPFFTMNKECLSRTFSPYLRHINPDFSLKKTVLYLFKGPFAQPIFDHVFVKSKPDFETPLPHFYIANLDMTYPYDRGTNYAVKLGEEVARLI